jgi:multiple sugar transport system substrate-binding protein
LRLLVIDDPPLAEQIERIWRARSQSVIEVRSAAWQEVSADGGLKADMVVYPAGLLGTLVERGWIEPLSTERLAAEPYQLDDLLPLERMSETYWGDQVYAVAFGSPVFCLIYRVDLLEEPGVAVPTTWAEYAKAAQTLAKAANAGGEAQSGDSGWAPALEPLAPGWAGQALLARAAAYVRRPAQYSDLFQMDTMAPQIDAPPFVRALEELVVAAQRSAPLDPLTTSPADAWLAVSTGRCAMALTWPASDQSDVGAKKPEAKLRLGVAILPGSSEVYRFDDGQWERRGGGRPQHAPLLAVAGRLGSVSRQSRRSEAAQGALALLASASWSEQIAPRSYNVTLFRYSHLARPDLWAHLERAAAQQYADAIEQAQQADAWMFSVRIPGRERYLAALDEAVRRAVQGEAAPQEALSQAAAEWRKITDELGVEAQRRAYRRSLGIATE